LPNHVKYCVSVLYPPLSNYQNTTSPRMGEPESPTGSWLTNAPLCFCFSFPSSLIFGPFFFFALCYSSSVCVLWSLIMSLFPLLCPLCVYSPVLFSLVFSVFSPGFLLQFFLWFVFFGPPSRSLSIYSLFILSFLVCVSVPLPFFLSFSLVCLHVTEFFCSL
jgi:hypothetical protein